MMSSEASKATSASGYAAGVAALYFFSGAAGLAYQVLWARMLSLQFGVSIFGVVITAAAFMLGLGLGSLQGGRLKNRNRRPLRLFALIEFSVACYALLLPLVLRLVDSGVLLLAPQGLVLWYALQLISALILVALPATLMGIGFPLVLRSVQHTGLSLGWIYGINTCGGALGALLPLLLLPTVGWVAGVWLVALLGLLVALAAWRLSGKTGVTEVVAKPAAAAGAGIELKTLLAYAGVGAAALMLEVGWTRLFGMLLLRTEYVMAVILAVFLVGIGFGSLLARHLLAKWWFDLLPVAAALFALLSLWAIPPLAAWAEQADFGSLAGAMVGQSTAIALITLPLTLLLGAWLPLLSARLGRDKTIGAVLYGANSIGAALGALVAGFVLIPWLGTSGAIVLAAMLLFVAGMAWAGRRSWFALPLLIAVAWPVVQLPAVNRLLPQGQAGSEDLYVHEDALAITHVVKRGDGQRLLLADLQRMDASSEPLAVVSQQNQVRLPLLLHPHPQSVLFLGLGTGISASASLAYPQLQRTAVELSQGAIDATRDWFASVNEKISDKMQIVRDDVRRYLQTTPQHYDVIIGDLFHPDLVGRSALLSLEQFERVRARLNQGGLFVQWLALNQFDRRSLQVVMRTFHKVFPDAVLFVDGFRLALVGGNGWQPSAQATLNNLSRLKQDALQGATGGEGVWSWLGRYWGPITVAGGPLQSEWAPVIEYDLPRARYRGDMDLVALVEWLLQMRPHVHIAGETLKVGQAQSESFERGYVATDLSLRAWVAELENDVAQGQRLLKLAYQANPRDRWVSGALADRMYDGLSRVIQEGMDRRKALEAILYIRPDHVDALRDLWHLEQTAGNTERAQEYRNMLQKYSPLDTALAQ
jgi:spermidine synthase